MEEVYRLLQGFDGLDEEMYGSLVEGSSNKEILRKLEN